MNCITVSCLIYEMYQGLKFVYKDYKKYTLHNLKNKIIKSSFIFPSLATKFLLLVLDQVILVRIIYILEIDTFLVQWIYKSYSFCLKINNI